jgi:hypothetical protein
MTTGHKVLEVTDKNNVVIDEIYNASKQVVEESENEDFSDKRPNEISNALEDRLRVKLHGGIPEHKVAGYPNVVIEREGETYYIEVKLAGLDQLGSSFRSFYYEPVELAKVKKDAYHILVGFAHQDRKVIKFKIVDVSKISVNLKSEFNTNNKELYKPEAILREY